MEHEIVEDKIFVMIASYRDPELIPTIEDCIKRARNPNLLTFGICWQHSDQDEWDNLDDYKSNTKFTIMDVNWSDSKGVCWARHHIQNMWKGEKYCMQLDSHHRFTENWDETLINMMVLTGSNKPIITAYAASYNPKELALTTQEPYKMYAFYSGDIIHFHSSVIDNYKELTSPIKARFVSGHFLFTYGIHTQECNYDPELYFTGEEISLSVRSFTNGYEIFHPHRIIIYHEYTRQGRTKHWDDFTEENTKNINKKLWYNFDSLCKDRVRCLLKQIEDPNINLGKYILGNVRMLEEYELYAGINFKKCLLHPDTILQKNPPINDISYKWNFDIIYYTFTLNIPKIDMTEIMFLGIFVEDNHGTNLFRQDLTEYIDILNISIQTHLKPYKWEFWPYSKTVGWSDKIEVFIM